MSDADRLLREALALHHAGRLREAQLVYARVLADDPENAEALHLSGLVAFRESRFDDAIGLLRRAVARAPGNALYLGNLGNVLRDSGRRNEAIESYERALAIDPEHVSLRNSLGAIKLEAGTTEAAIQDFREVIARKPDHFRAHLNLGNALRRSENLEAAERAYRRALALNPDSADALSELALLLSRQDRSDEALELLKRRSVVDPDSVSAHAVLARALERSGDHEGALASYQQALAIEPDALDVRCDFCALLQKTCDWERLALHAHGVIQAIAQGRSGIPSRLLVLLHDVTPSMQLQAARANAFALADRVAVSTRRIDAATRRLRIGYLSSGESDITSSLAEVLERHDRARCEVFLFGRERAEKSPLRARFRNAADTFSDIATLDDERCARRIAESSIDILVDVDGNTENGRMGIAALRPAPIQVSWLGIPATRGADWYDYIIADRHVAPPGVEPLFAEQIVGLPDCYLSPGRSRPQPAAHLTRADCGLPADAVVICCFSEPSTITAPMFALWLRVLSAVPKTILWLADDNALASASLRGRAAQQGIAPERLVLAPTRPPIEALARYRVADLAIDTFACVSSSTAADALWMGCPLATLTGDTFASRIATSFLANLGLSELAAVSPARYEELIIDLAVDGARRDALRDRLQHAVTAMPLFDTARFVQNLERAYAQMITNAGQGTSRAFDLR
jgi:protein O-GlcNAc transferase